MSNFNLLVGANDKAYATYILKFAYKVDIYLIGIFLLELPKKWHFLFYIIDRDNEGI